LSIVNVPPYTGVLAAVAVVVVVAVEVVTCVVVVVDVVVLVVVLVCVVAVVVGVVVVFVPQEDSTKAATSKQLNPNHMTFFLIGFLSFFTFLLM